MTTTIEDVAQAAGVSTATVSRALRGLPNVAPSTRDHVRQVAEALNYAIDSHASRLASGRSTTIGIVMPLADQWFYNRVSTSAEAVLSAGGYDVLRYSIAAPEEQTEALRRLISGKRVDGVLIINLALANADVSLMAEGTLPVVTIETDTGKFPAIGCNNVAAAQTATRHLINLGHRQIGLISGLPDDPMHFAIPLEREQGYRQALAEHGIEVRPELNVPGNFSFAGGAEAMAQLLSIHHPPTGVFALSDEMAIGALKTIRDVGLRVPEDISVIGFDDHDVAAYVGLTTIRQPVAGYGEQAARLLLARLSGEKAAGESRIELPTQLIVRDTTGPCREKGE
ncbi:MAG: LacI family DNA-binding transcriptional regulator [Anaerolineae bacterium]|nr:LacI family DNA-binding transcriptional regulator [Anaerolineae bacterium]